MGVLAAAAVARRRAAGVRCCPELGRAQTILAAPVDRLTSLQTGRVQSLTLTYDPASNVASTTDSAGTPETVMRIS